MDKIKYDETTFGTSQPTVTPHELKVETDVAGVISRVITRIIADIDRDLDDVIIQSFQRIADEAFIHISVDRDKVLDMLKRNKPAKPNDDGMPYTCPNCKRVVSRYFMYYCANCGQHLDWSDI